MSENYFLYATGFNENGQLTLREKQIITYPQKIEQFGEKKVILIAPGYENVLYLLENNELQQFGISNENHSKFFEDKSQIKNIKAGQDHFIVLTEDGSVYWWKAANSNSIYNESTTPKSPSLVLLNFPVKEIIAGGHSSYFLLENGDLFGLGANNQHQISSQEKQFFDEPILISSNVERAFSGCYSHQVFFIKSNKKLYCRGYNQYGQLGTGNTKNQQKDFHLKFFRNQNIVDISCGYCHTLIWIDSGKTQSIYSAGYMEYNGLNQDSHSTKFKRLLKYQDKRIIQISSGSQFSYILIPNNEFIVFGWNDDGQLGTRDNVNIKQPKTISFPEFPKHIDLEVICGSYSTFFKEKMNTYHSIQDDMLQLLKSNELCDTSVKTTDGETISFHSLIVNSRTKIPLSKLKDILFTKTKEEVEEILTFLYSLRTKNYERLEQFCKEIEYPELISRNKSNLYEKDFESLFKEETNKDFSIICGETEFKVHKIILFARSELFRGMFLSVQDDSGKVHDYRQSSPQAIQKLIEFFYLDQIHEQIPKEIISELEEMIDFYQLHPQTKLIYELRKKGNEK